MVPRGGEALSRERLFALVCDEAMKDGVLEPFERELLTRLAGFLKLSSDQARRALSEAKARFDRGELGTVRPLEPGTLYAKALAAVLEDGVVDDQEKKLLAGVRQLLGVDQGRHEEILSRVKAAMVPPAAEGAPAPVPPAPPVVEPALRPSAEGKPMARPKPARAPILRPTVAPTPAAPGPLRLPWAAMAAVSLVVTFVAMVGVVSPTALPSERLRQRLVLNQKPTSVTSSGDTALQAKLRLLFGLKEAVPTFIGPLELRAGSTYHVGVDLFSTGPGRASGGKTFTISASLVLLPFVVATEEAVDAVRVQGRGEKLSDQWTRFEFYEFTPPSDGPFLLTLAGRVENASPNAEVWMTRFPSLGRRTVWVVVAFLSGVFALVTFGLALRPR